MARASRHFPLLVACALATVAALPVSARAHAVVTRATLRDATIAADTPTTTTLEFNSSIEAKLAKVTLVDDQGVERTLDLAPGEHPSNVLVVALPALAAGHYALKYKVLAADGHVTESVLRFQVVARK